MSVFMFWLIKHRIYRDEIEKRRDVCYDFRGVCYTCFVRCHHIVSALQRGGLRVTAYIFVLPIVAAVFLTPPDRACVTHCAGSKLPTFCTSFHPSVVCIACRLCALDGYVCG